MHPFIVLQVPHLLPLSLDTITLRSFLGRMSVMHPYINQQNSHMLNLYSLTIHLLSFERLLFVCCMGVCVGVGVVGVGMNILVIN